MVLNLFIIALILAPLPANSAASQKSMLWTPHKRLVQAFAVLGFAGVYLIHGYIANAKIVQLFKFGSFVLPAMLSIVLPVGDP